MKSILRPPTAEEKKEPYKYSSIFAFQQWRAARREVAADAVQVVEFDVKRAWFESLCGGADCCPNCWILETADDNIIRFDSWNYLPIVDPVFTDGHYEPLKSGKFPGRQVVVVRWPITGRVITAHCKGETVPIENGLPEGRQHLSSQWNQCLIYGKDELPAPLREALEDIGKRPNIG